MPDSVQPETDDFTLMAQVRAGREDAFRILVERHRRPLLNFFARLGASNHGEDLAQMTFVRLWTYRKKYKPTAKFTTFLYTLARHTWLDFLRRQKRFRLFADRYREEIPVSSDGGLPRLQRQRQVRQHHLPPLRRQRHCPHKRAKTVSHPPPILISPRSQRRTAH